MTITELRKKVTDSPNSEKLLALSIEVNYTHINFSKELKGIVNIYSFILHEVKGWNSFENLPEILEQSRKHFENVKSISETFIEYMDNPEFVHYRSYWAELKRNLSSENASYRGANYKVFLHNSPETEFLYNLSKKGNHSTLRGAYGYLIKQTDVIEVDYFAGILKAYEYSNQDLEILKRRHSEKISLSKIRQQFHDHITEAESHLNEYLINTKDNLVDHFKRNDNLKEENNTNYQEWYKKIALEYDDFYERAKENMRDLEDTYALNLKLKGPAKYWKDRGDKLKKEGNKWSIFFFIAIGVGALSLFILLWQIPDGMFLKLFKGEASAIKWTIVYITFISFIAYSVKILAKLTFSSYHLSRDAEEREQLSYFYLALKKDSDVSDQERQLILQSLFSRSDTGLLKEDSSPTMPTGVEKHFNLKG